MMLAGTLCMVPYAAPGLEALRPWQPGSPIPFTGLFEFKPPVRAAIGGVAGKGEVERTTEDLLRVAPLPEAKVVDDPLLEEAPPDLAPYRIDPAEYGGMTRAIVGPPEAMAHFHDRLLAVARKELGAMVRVAMYSDSINGADRVSSVMRHQLQARFGDAGKGWVPIAPGWQYQRHQDVRWSTERKWRTYVVNRGNGPEHHYGLGGVVATNQAPGARASFATIKGEGAGRRVSRYRLFYQAWPGGGDVTLHLDGGEPQRLSTHAPQVEDRFHDLEVSDGPHALEVRSGDPKTFRGYGVVMERDRPGVVVDGLQLIGAFVRVLRNFDVAHWQRQLRERETDLVVFWLGGNDAVSSSVPFVRDRFVSNYTEVIQRARRARPKMSCLVISVLDSADKVGGQVRTRTRVPQLVEAQQEVAEATGCAFFNAYEAIGGHGTMRRWYRSSPRLVEGDYRHLTEAGSRVVGTLFYKAMLKAYDEHLASQ
jgi:lysophospholipase L1-like esterase